MKIIEKNDNYGLIVQLDIFDLIDDRYEVLEEFIIYEED